MPTYKGKDITIVREELVPTEDKVVFKDHKGNFGHVPKKDIKFEHTQQLSKHVPVSTTKDVTLDEHKNTNKKGMGTTNVNTR